MHYDEDPEETQQQAAVRWALFALILGILAWCFLSGLIFPPPLR